MIKWIKKRIKRLTCKHKTTVTTYDGELYIITCYDCGKTWCANKHTPMEED